MDNGEEGETLAVENSPYFNRDPAYKMDDFELLEEIGSGSYGVVYKCRDKSYTNKMMALKQLDLEQDIDESNVQVFENESKILKSLDHQNIVKMYDSFRSGPNGYIVMELLHKNLRNHVRSIPGGLPLDAARIIGKKLLLALAFCHNRNIIHRDFKPDNIFVSIRGEPKVGDFGSARDMSATEGDMTQGVTTSNYRSPEQFLGDRNYTAKIDIWSWGCTLAEALTGKFLFDLDTATNALAEIFKLRGTHEKHNWPNFDQLPHAVYFVRKYPAKNLHKVMPKIHYNPDALQVFEAALQCCPQYRPTANQLLDYKFFQ